MSSRLQSEEERWEGLISEWRDKLRLLDESQYVLSAVAQQSHVALWPTQSTEGSELGPTFADSLLPVCTSLDGEAPHSGGPDPSRVTPLYSAKGAADFASLFAYMPEQKQETGGVQQPCRGRPSCRTVSLQLSMLSRGAWRFKSYSHWTKGKPGGIAQQQACFS